jgi:hypothetical protein
MGIELQKEEVSGLEGRIGTVCGPCVYGRHEECEKTVSCICASNKHSL